MAYAASYLRAGARRLLGMQLGLTLAAAAAGLVWSGAAGGWGALFGGGIALVNTTVLTWRIGRAGLLADNRPQAGVAALYAGAALRFLLTLLLFAFGMGVLRLSPVPMLVAFGTAQLGFLSQGWRPQGRPQP